MNRYVSGRHGMKDQIWEMDEDKFLAENPEIKKEVEMAD